MVQPVASRSKEATRTIGRIFGVLILIVRILAEGCFLFAGDLSRGVGEWISEKARIWKAKSFSPAAEFENFEGGDAHFAERGFTEFYFAIAQRNFVGVQHRAVGRLQFEGRATQAAWLEHHG